jgi:hypothetical protein
VVVRVGVRCHTRMWAHTHTHTHTHTHARTRTHTHTRAHTRTHTHTHTHTHTQTHVRCTYIQNMVMKMLLALQPSTVDFCSNACNACMCVPCVDVHGCGARKRACVCVCVGGGGNLPAHTTVTSTSTRNVLRNTMLSFENLVQLMRRQRSLTCPSIDW